MAMQQIYEKYKEYTLHPAENFNKRPFGRDIGQNAARNRQKMPYIRDLSATCREHGRNALRVCSEHVPSALRTRCEQQPCILKINFQYINKLTTI